MGSCGLYLCVRFFRILCHTPEGWPFYVGHVFFRSMDTVFCGSNSICTRTLLKRHMGSLRENSFVCFRSILYFIYFFFIYFINFLYVLFIFFVCLQQLYYYSLFLLKTILIFYMATHAFKADSRRLWLVTSVFILGIIVSLPRIIAIVHWELSSSRHTSWPDKFSILDVFKML